jgi:hypothetical protein
VKQGHESAKQKRVSVKLTHDHVTHCEYRVMHYEHCVQGFVKHLPKNEIFGVLKNALVRGFRAGYESGRNYVRVLLEILKSLCMG